jgi:hypothetical protein
MCTTEAAIVTGGVLKGTADFLGAQQAALSQEFQAETSLNEARMLDVQASDTAAQGATEAARTRTATSQAVAAQVASTAGAGIDIGGATAIEVFQSIEGAGIADILEIQSNTKKRIWALRETAKIRRAEARAGKKAARITRFLAPIAFAGPVLTAKGQVGLLKKKESAETT